ncbi:tyrosine--tRNA ligase [Candidatus Sumerlaeota bacterium]|nr:tyrosine--tRNA ligase [Candidatus Sumerlaeota bacterium]
MNSEEEKDSGETLEVPPELREEWDILTAGAVEVLPREEFLARLSESKKKKTPIRIKLGCDPSSPDLHVGHTIVINKLKQFQDFGHQVVFIVGDFTARIGDPTGKSETRKALTAEQTAENAKTYLEQIFKILDPEKTEVVGNAQWFDKMTMNDAISLASKYTVARMLERDDFSKRYAAQRPIHIHEFLYPLVQGYDSIMVRADIELGGTDQKFNLLVGRELMQEAGMRGQCIMTMPLLVGLDGAQKMSKSLGNAIGITEPPGEIFGKAMSVPDEMMRDYYLLVLSYPPSEVEKLMAEIKEGKLHPREAKARMARELAARYHGGEAAEEAQAQFDKVFRDKDVPDEIEEIDIALEAGQTALRLVEVIVRGGLADSNAQAKRLIQQGGISVNGTKAASEKEELQAGEYLLKAGKRHFRKIKLTPIR